MTQAQASARPAFNLYDASLLPSAPVGNWRRWGLRLALWLMVAAVFALTLRYDLLLMQWRYAVFPEGPKGILKQVFYGFRDFAQVLPIFVTLFIIARVDARRWTIITCILLAQILAGIACNSGKFTVSRYRPHRAIEQAGSLDDLSGDKVWLGFSLNHRDDVLQSFPSGHSAGAFALAGVLSWFYPRLAGMFWFLAIGCAFSRYVDAVHWLSDCLAGAAIGYVGAWLALRPYAWAVPWWLIRGRIRVAPTGRSG